MLLSGLTLSGCSLDETPVSKFDEKAAYDNSNLIFVNSVANVYSAIGNNIYGGDNGIQSMNMVSSDMVIVPGRQGDWVDGGKWQNLSLHNFSPSQDMFVNNWNHIYSIVGLCNASIAKLEGLKSQNPDVEAYQYELRALRAVYYYLALDNWGNIPIVTSAEQSLADVKQLSRPKVFEWVVSELNACIPHLSAAMSQNTGEFYGRMTQGIVYACLAKCAINAPIYNTELTSATSMQKFLGSDYSKAAKASSEVAATVTELGKSIQMTVDGTERNAWATAIYCADKLAELGYRLESNYATNFAVSNINSKENIFVRPNDDKIYKLWDSNQIRSWHYNHAAAMKYSGWNGMCATLHAVKIFGLLTDADLDRTDPRFKLNFYAYKDYADECGLVEDGVTGKDLEYLPLAARVDYNATMQKAEGWTDEQLKHIVKCGGARMRKYEFDRTSTIIGDNNNDLVIWRYADAVLIKAEAQLRLGQTADALATLNSIRERVGATPRTAIDFNTILDERMMEFMWEDSRRTDQVRFGTWTLPTADRYPGVSHNASAGDFNDDRQGYTCVYPIPQAVLDLNKSFKQNPGYAD